MAAYVFATAKDSFNLSTLLSVSVVVSLVYTGVGHWQPNQLTSQFVSEINPADIVATCAPISNATLVNGVYDGDDTTFGIVAAGPAVQGVVGYVDTGNPATSQLLWFSDAYTGLPITPTGTKVINMVWASGGIFQY